MVKIQPEFGTMIVGTAAHDVDPHRRLGIDVVTNPADARKYVCEPRLIRENALVEPLNKAHNRVLTKNRIQLPKLNRLINVG